MGFCKTVAVRSEELALDDEHWSAIGYVIDCWPATPSIGNLLG
jgi:hypothetical protein